MNYHLRSDSGSNGPIAKECHRFLVAGPFKLLRRNYHDEILFVPYSLLRIGGCSPSCWRPDLSGRVESAKLPAFAQTFYFDSKFLPSGYSLTLTRPKEGDKIGMTCHQKSDTLSCESSFEGKTSSTSTRVSGPCLVTVDEAPGLDFLWAFAAMLRMPSAGAPNPICGYVLKEETLGAISLTSNSSSERIVLAGEQTAEILGKRQTVRTYEVGNNDPVTWGKFGERSDRPQACRRP